MMESDFGYFLLLSIKIIISACDIKSTSSNIYQINFNKIADHNCNLNSSMTFVQTHTHPRSQSFQPVPLQAQPH